MKKILIAMVLFVFVALPMSVMAMTSISDNDLSTVTGQAGVSIGADITMNVSFGTVAWGDSDGIGGTTTPGWVGLRNGSIDNLRIHMRSDLGMVDATLIPSLYAQFIGSYPSLTTTDVALMTVLGTQELLTIDVYSTSATGKTYVRIGVPTFEVTMTSFTAEAGLWTGTAAAPDQNYFQKLGDISVRTMVMLLGKGNYIDISQNETTSGILINVANKGAGNFIDDLTIASMSWGDTDGLTYGSTTNTGYVGLTDFHATAIKVAATLSINVATPNGAGIPALLTMLHGDVYPFNATLATLRAGLKANNVGMKDDVAYILNKTGVIGTTSVDIQIQANVNIGTMVASVATGITADLANAAATKNLLGQFYLRDLTVAVPAYNGTYGASWVSISAH